jgi:hypothetical protein
VADNLEREVGSNGAARSSSPWNAWRVGGWAMAALLLLLPAAAMQFTTAVDWDETDFIVMGVMIGTAGLAIELLVRRSASAAYRGASVITVAAAFLTIWTNLAVGMIGSEDNPMNLLFAGVLLVALTGALLARFSSPGMARALVATALAQAAAGATGLALDPRGAIFSIAFAGLWLLAAALYWIAARGHRSPRAP